MQQAVMETMNHCTAAHTPNESGHWHCLKDHLQAVAQMAEEFAGKFGAGELGYWTGLLHDIGKYNPAFQDYLNAAYQANLTHQTPPRRGSVPHSIYGAVIARTAYANIYPNPGNTIEGEELAWAIMAHHGGLTKPTLLEDALARAGNDTDVVQIIRTAATQIPKIKDLVVKRPLFDQLPHNRAREFFIRMLLSALVDADYLDTEKWRDPWKHRQRAHDLLELPELWRKVQANQETLMAKSEPTQINKARKEIYRFAIQNAWQSPGFFKLTVPTGGGKTRTALSFALKHAVENRDHGFQRVIFVMPYTSIIEQTAGEFRKIVGSENVLEHHSAIDFDEDEQKDIINWSRLAAENWDAPIIVTTTVQLFESLFANRPSRVRKLHNLARSIIVLDEAQMLPAPLLNPILDALSELVERYGTSVVLCTATQPALDESLGFPALANIRELAPDPKRYFQSLARVRYDVCLDEPWGWDQVARGMRKSPQVLCVLNTKGQARDLFKTLDDPKAFHLSTGMCPAHRRDVLKQIKDRLKAGEPCSVVSTQLVEAGVNLDFPMVLRALGPLDSIVQAAGRCNREGKMLGQGTVVVFKPKEHKLPSGVYESATLLAERILRRGEDLHSLEIFQTYFRKLYHELVERDAKGIQKLREQFEYATVAERFRMIEDNTISILSPYRLASRHLSIPHQGIDRETMRALQPYLVNLYRSKLGELSAEGLIVEIVPGLWEWQGEYSEKLGILCRFDQEKCVF